MQARNAVVRRCEPVAGLQHFARGPGVLPVGFVIKIAPAGCRHMQQRSQGNEQNEKGVARRWRLQRGRLGQSIVKRKRADGCDHANYLSGERAAR